VFSSICTECYCPPLNLFFSLAFKKGSPSALIFLSVPWSCFGRAVCASALPSFSVTHLPLELQARAPSCPKAIVSVRFGFLRDGSSIPPPFVPLRASPLPSFFSISRRRPCRRTEVSPILRGSFYSFSLLSGASRLRAFHSGLGLATRSPFPY